MEKKRDSYGTDLEERDKMCPLLLLSAQRDIQLK